MTQLLTVELIGAARVLAGQAEISLTLADGATWRDALTALARAVPGLVDEVISREGRDLIGEYALKLGGRTFVSDLDESVRVPEDGRVTLMDLSDI